MSYKRISPQPIVEGGTGVVTMTTAYAPVCAGTTATGSLQVASTGLSTSGYVLTSNGSSSLPSFQAASGGSSSSTTYVSSTPYTVLSTDDVILVDTSTIGAASTIKFPNAPATDGQVWTVKDWSGSSNSYPITITTVGGSVTIDGAVTFVMQSNYESISIAWSVAEATYSIVNEVLPANIFLPASGSVTGRILMNNSTVLHTHGSGNIYAGASAGNFTGTGARNTVVGSGALSAITTGADNISLGNSSLASCTTSAQNIAIGTNALNALVTSASGGSGCIAIGYNSMEIFTGTSGNGTNVCIGSSTMANYHSGAGNVAVGWQALRGGSGPTGSYNSVVGFTALNSITSGSYNSAIGEGSGSNYSSTESSNILINNAGVNAESNVCRIGAATGTGNQQLNSTYIAGIQGITVTGTAVLVSSSDQLGIAVSSARFKDNIEDMDSYSSDILKLRPVTFNYNVGDDRSLQGGLIAEEVYNVMPALVVLDKQGLPQTVKYHDLPAMLLNEIQKMSKRIDDLEAKMRG